MKFRVWISGQKCCFGGDDALDIIEIEDVYFIDCDRDTERKILDAMRGIEHYGHRAEEHGNVKVERVTESGRIPAMA
jgi:hypothetical protein